MAGACKEEKDEVLSVFAAIGPASLECDIVAMHVHSLSNSFRGVAARSMTLWCMAPSREPCRANFQSGLKVAPPLVARSQYPSPHNIRQPCR